VLGYVRVAAAPYDVIQKVVVDIDKDPEREDEQRGAKPLLVAGHQRFAVAQG
jgi:hypothetical protein